MKINHNARSIAGFAFLLPILAGCEAVGLPDLMAHDEVPSEIKAMPRDVAVPTEADLAAWPRLGDVPAKPKTFSPKPVYEQAMDELLYEREEGERMRQEAEAAAPAPSFAIDMPTPPVGATATQATSLKPPKFKFGKDQ
jgi:hypothetical protein